LATPVLAITLLLLIAERVLKIGIFDPALGGDAVLFQHFFWFYSHPAVYIMILPGLGVISELIPVFSRKPIFGYRAIAYSSFGIALIAFIVWGHHLFVSGQSEMANFIFSLLTMFVAVPTGIKVFSWVATLYRGSIRFNVPMLYALGFLELFTIGGLTGVFLATLAIDVHLTDTYFVIAHFHYVMVGGTLMAMTGGIHYWFPKMTGKMLDKRLSWIAFWLTQVGFNVAFIGMFFVGLQGQPRRVEAYADVFSKGNLITTIGAYTIMIGMLVLLHAVISSWRSGVKAPMNPWQAKTLEWTVPNPVPLENFDVLPTVTSDAYGYGRKQS
jgi:cytochrome c oxidase subunit 1